ncbi:MAG: TetR/AcrR family transcriptional regulator [Gordonia sp. (in: high G+C Gram-positive bacteria)]|uniref:TetR/AcrR family transcriptional regulator n=1 Tax=Gordonia sp. (in: high G+C Gram-positive bacteria) TaxID=84139 RepID=UPI0039E4F975
MGRPAKYSDDAILDAALGLVAAEGPQGATVVAIAERLGAPSGSIYHRFVSRDLVLARLWIRTVRRFQTGFVDALVRPDPDDAARAAVTHVLNWCRQHPDEARVLTLYRRDDLVARWPDELGAELATLNGRVEREVRSFAGRRFGAATAETVGLTRFALVDLPYAAARQIILDDGPVPEWLGGAVLSAARGALATGTRPA